LGFFSYFQSYIKDFAETAKPLTELTKNGVPHQIRRTQEYQQAFDNLKSDLANATKLHVIQFGEPCGILVDDSSISVGCCLIQWAEDGLEKPIAFASAKLMPTQTCWSTIEREAYAVMFALRKFRNFVFGTEVTVFSDHNPLMYLRECAP